MSLVDLTGAYDLHVHANPELFLRIGDDLDLARHASQSGLAGIMIKNHFESTVGRAALADRMVEGTRVFGGLVLNWFTGGLNPLAAETALRMGARQIWMPTVDATAHAAAFGQTGGFTHQKSGLKLPRPGISVLGEDLTEDFSASPPLRLGVSFSMNSNSENEPSASSCSAYQA